MPGEIQGRQRRRPLTASWSLGPPSIRTAADIARAKTSVICLTGRRRNPGPGGSHPGRFPRPFSATGAARPRRIRRTASGSSIVAFIRSRGSLENQAGNDDNTLGSLASDGSANLRDRKVTSSATRMSGMRGTVGGTLLLLLVLSAPVAAQDDADLAKKTPEPRRGSHFGAIREQCQVRGGAARRRAVHSQHSAGDSRRLTDEWNLISRTIAPVIYQPELAAGVGETPGLGDIQQ